MRSMQAKSAMNGSQRICSICANASPMQIIRASEYSSRIRRWVRRLSKRFFVSMRPFLPGDSEPDARKAPVVLALDLVEQQSHLLLLGDIGHRAPGEYLQVPDQVQMVVGRLLIEPDV